MSRHPAVVSVVPEHTRMPMWSTSSHAASRGSSLTRQGYGCLCCAKVEGAQFWLQSHHDGSPVTPRGRPVQVRATAVLGVPTPERLVYDNLDLLVHPLAVSFTDQQLNQLWVRLLIVQPDGMLEARGLHP
jgi:hypothetical protein